MNPRVGERTGGGVWTAPPTAIEVVASLAAHRALSSAQVRTMHMPGATSRWCRYVLAGLEAAGLVAHVAVAADGPVRNLWFATEAGMRTALEAGALDRPTRVFEATEVSGPLRAHTEAVNDAAIGVLVAARDRGEEFGPMAWRHEVAHPLARGPQARRRRAVIADAVLTYVRTADGRSSLVQRFLELDRATLAVDALAAELTRYADLFRAADPAGEPIWRGRYRTFPGVLCVLAGAERKALLRRRDIALALMRSDPQMTRTPEVEVRVCLLSDLVAEGPFAPIFRSLREPGEAVGWLGKRKEEDEE